MKKITKIINGVGVPSLFKRITVSRGNLKNGTVIIFNYGGKGERVGLVVNAKVPTGISSDYKWFDNKKSKSNIASTWYCVNTENSLVNVIKLDSSIGNTIGFLSKALEKHDSLGKNQLLGLAAIVGKGSFRTYNIELIRNLYKLDYIKDDE